MSNEFDDAIEKLRSTYHKYADWLHAAGNDTGGLVGFFREYTARFIQEAHGYILCIEGGVEVAASHHARAIIESFAGLCYILSPKSEEVISQDKKLKMWREFVSIKEYLFFRELEKLVNMTALNDEEILEEYGYSKESIASGIAQHKLEKREHWKILFGLDLKGKNEKNNSFDDALKRVKYWHHPKSITSLLSDFVPEILKEHLSKDERYKGWHSLYQNLSNLTHPNHFARLIMAAGPNWSLKIRSPARSIRSTAEFLDLIGRMSCVILPTEFVRPKL